jgi:hypothetical protein
MITLALNDHRGRRVGRVTLPLSKSEVATRVLDRLQKGDLTPAGAQHQLVSIDSGAFPYGTLAKLFTPDEIRDALERRLDSLSVEEEELHALREILAAHDAARAGGGDSVSRR